jgi:hypothetical protein
MSENRQNQGGLALRNEPKGEARKPTEGTAARVAKRAAESPAPTDQRMEEVVEGENLKRAWKRVKANQGSPGVDGMTVFALKDYLNEHWPAIREQLLTGKYQPKPVLRVEIEKPDGGMRKLDYRSLNSYTITVSSILYFQRKTTGSALISSKYWWMRSISSCLLATRIPRSIVRAILLN